MHRAAAPFIHRKVAPRRPAPVAARARPPATPAVAESRSARCACGGGCPRCENNALLSRPGDRSEVEADRTADTVMRSLPAAARSGSHAAAQVAPHLDTSRLPLGVAQTLRGPGEPLDAATRRQMGSRFGQDFSRVRIFRGAQAERSAEAVNARAYTVGNNVVFGPGQYAPGTSAGQRLLAHELAHVAQQGAGSPAAGRPLIQRDEKEPADDKKDSADKPKSAGGAARVAAAIKILQNSKRAVLADPSMKEDAHKFVAGVRTFLENTITDVPLADAFQRLPYTDRSHAIDEARNALGAIKYFEDGYRSDLPSWDKAASWDDVIGALQLAQDKIAVLLGDPLPDRTPPPVDDGVVWHYINDALKRYNGSVFDAWRGLSAQRDFNPQDQNLAAAEHYMYNRWLSKSMGGFFAMDLAVGYGMFKDFMNETVGIPPPSFSDEPATPSSDAQVRFGIAGAWEDSWWHALF